MPTEPQPSAEDRGASAVRRAFFARAQTFALRFGVSLDEVIEHLHFAQPDESRWDGAWMEDVVMVVATLRGDQHAWNELTLTHHWRLRELAHDATGPMEGALVLERFMQSIRRNGPSGPLGEYDGSRSLAAWLASRLAGHLGQRFPSGLDMERKPRTLSIRSADNVLLDRSAT